MTMKIALLVLIACTVSGSAVFIGNAKCTWGPSYWCQDYKHAVECDALVHCKEKVWNNVKDSCSVCVLVAEKAKDFLEDKVEQKKVLAVLEDFCTKEAGPFAALCKQKIDEYFPSIIGNLSKLLQDPKKVCTALGLCGAQDKKLIMAAIIKYVLHEKTVIPSIQMRKPIHKLQSVEDSCSVCEMVAEKAKAFLGDEAEQKKVLAVLEDFCTKEAGPFAALCKQKIDEYFPIIIGNLTKLLQDPKKVCTALGLCGAQDKKLIMAAVIKYVLHEKTVIPSIQMRKPIHKLQSVEDSCSACELVAEKAKDFLGDKAEQKKVLAVLEDFCTKEAGPFAALCKQKIDEYFPIIIGNLTKLLQDPKKVCTALGLCGAQDKKLIMAALIKQVLHKKTVIPSIQMRKPIHTLPSAVKASPQCILCEFVMSELDKVISDQSTQQEIEAALTQVCGFLPSTISTECITFVKEYGPVILQVLAQELKPSIICTSLHLCTGKNAKKDLIVPIKKPVIKLKASTETCKLCIDVVTIVKKMAADNVTEEQIEEALELVCDYMIPVEAECKALIKEYLPQIFKLVASADPKAVCEEIKLCASSLVHVPCELGASYWCRSPEVARKCNAFRYCKIFVWRK